MHGYNRRSGKLNFFFRSIKLCQDFSAPYETLTALTLSVYNETKAPQYLVARINIRMNI